MVAGIIIGVVVLIVIAIIVWAIGTYNRFIALRQSIANAWAQTDVLMKKRTDLVPNLVETVKGYAAHESEVFTKVTKARAQAVQASADPATTLVQRAAAESELSRALMQLTATAEAYPNLQANQNFMELQKELSALEDRIAYARMFYNDVVLKFNTLIQSFPSNVIAKQFHFTEGSFFQVTEAERQVPSVKF